MAVGAVLLVASSTSLSASSSAAPGTGAPVVSDPAPAASADGGVRADAAFPLVAARLASGRFVHAMPPVMTGHIPATALAAYRRAVERTDLAQPNCHIPLELLAAIGKVESGHARGGQVDATGRTAAPILGPVLNGGPFAAIRDTDGGALDGDRRWDRAVGPMQFIPGTWTHWQVDGNDDGVRDPHNVYDASLAAARYLCAANRDLGTPAGLDEAVLSYNHSTSYLSLVRSWMSVYRNGTIGVADITDADWVAVPLATGLPDSVADPVPSAPVGSPSTPSTHPSTPPSTPPSAPPSAPPSTPPSAPPSSSPPSVPPSVPPSTPPSPPSEPAPPSPPEPPVAEEPVTCDLLDTVGGVVDGLLGGAPDCALPLELSAPERTGTVTASPAP